MNFRFIKFSLVVVVLGTLLLSSCGGEDTRPCSETPNGVEHTTEELENPSKEKEYKRVPQKGTPLFIFKK